MTTTTDNGTLVDLVSRCVQRHPQRPAVSDGTTTLTYEELDRRSDAVGALVRSHGVRPEERVAVCLPRSADLIVAILGIIKVGAAYVAIDDGYPEARRDHLLLTSGAKLVVAGRGAAGALAGVPTMAVPVGDGSTSDGPCVDQAPRSDSLAALVFTSGSSGEPKGILVEHGSLVSFATNPSLPRLRVEDRVGQTLSVSFDGFQHELWCTLAAGAELVILPSIPDLLAADLRRELRTYGMTVMSLPAMVINHVAREDPEAFSPLRILISGGDILLSSACRAVLNSSFDGELYNLYGPAEITTACTIHRVTLDDVASGTIPIGVGLAGTTIHVLDPELREVPVGQTGEIYVAGLGVTRGYLSSPDLTAERFPVVAIAGVPTRMYRTGDLARRRDDGCLLFVGRVDRQVKIRGYRVEPGEVEQALLRYSGVGNAVVLADGEGNDRRLVAFVVLSDGLDAEQLRFLAERDLPAFMVPSEFLVLDELPFTEHGKRESAALREMLARHRARTEAVQGPQSDTERYLVGLWEELLLVDRIGRDDDFYAVGGHSLLAFRIIERISKDLDIRLEFETVLDTPVLKDLAAELDAARVEVGR